MSVKLLQHPPLLETPHDHLYDRESALWVILWLGLRYSYDMLKELAGMLIVGCQVARTDTKKHNEEKLNARGWLTQTIRKYLDKDGWPTEDTVCDLPGPPARTIQIHQLVLNPKLLITYLRQTDK